MSDILQLYREAMENLRQENDRLEARIAELEAEIDQLTAHDATERKDDKSPNDTQDIVYKRE